MNELNLSKRLKTVASFIPKGAVLADIGSDHAYLPCYAIIHKTASFAIAGEVSEGPFSSALNQVRECELDDFISVRKGDGLEVINSSVTCITVAGMGGELIKSILENGKEKLTNVKTLILQPNIHAIIIRKWLLNQGWELKNEVIIEEDGKIYEILVAEKGDSYEPYNPSIFEEQLLLGPFLMAKKEPVFMKKWLLEQDHLEKVLKQMEMAKQDEKNKKKKLELTNKLTMIKGALSDE
ncbi:tRNA (adenine(22)-N(1))-methyltransferase TrmK [Bacillus carboniphilus]|uniref:tRNA (Adenine(22)-N(1))-methyltransferase TrmK n=1 Tax=Bacillus carboniphilus TaxID=86663 RepID=A0ABY9JX51_9BACI|nr:tRNA (adenine(22)-N(1))-methyltransferase TrmK [Bacillus carboniphilus]WLR43971.1 tRNA (adenine(22)-N(1))-methyltransferase TrmK [Bacillus carboniphilus]